MSSGFELRARARARARARGTARGMVGIPGPEGENEDEVRSKAGNWAALQAASSSSRGGGWGAPWAVGRSVHRSA